MIGRMILVDTSIWVDHLRKGNDGLSELLTSANVLAHPHVIGELACGNLSNREQVLQLLGELPSSTVAADQEVLYFIEQNKLMGRGIGYVDAHLLAAASLSGPAALWTRDRKLQSVANDLGLGFDTT